ncbi:MAG: helix-turn-helix transcriptional regulator [Sphingomicrobium sp.]
MNEGSWGTNNRVTTTSWVTPVKRQFDHSASSSWSASAGAIYPLMKKLERLKLLEAASGDGGARLFRLTEEGEMAFQEWVRSLPANAGEAMPEPIRTRAFFLESMSQRERATFLAGAQARTEAALKKPDVVGTARPSGFAGLASFATKLELEARLKWIASARQFLDALPPRIGSNESSSSLELAI